jgi:hypothetical protein
MTAGETDMSDRIATLVIDIQTKDSATTVLQALERRMQQADKAARAFAANVEKGGQAAGRGFRTAADGAERLGAASSITQRGIAQMAAAQARLAQAAGDGAGAERILTEAIGKLNSESIEAIRLQTQLINTQARLSSAKGPVVLPRTIAGLSNEAAAAVTRFATLGAVLGGASAAFDKASEAFALKATMEQNQGAFRVLIGDVGKANQAFAAGSEFARRYAFTQSEIADSLRVAAPLLKSTSASTEEALGVLSRLAQLNPAQGLEGATVALRELASGDIVSLVERFNVARGAANEMKAEIAAGSDVFAVFGKYLDDSGVSLDLLKQRTEGAQGALNKYKAAQDELNLALGTFVAGPGTGFLNFLTSVTQGTTLLTQKLATGQNSFATFQGQLLSTAGGFAEYQAASNGAAQGFGALIAQ